MRLAGISYTQSGLVWGKVESLPMLFWLPLSSLTPRCFLPLQLLSQGAAGMSTPQEEVTREREAIVVAETNRVEVVRVAEASIREAAVARERAAADVRDAKDQATLAVREAQERVSRVEVESAAALAFARGEAEDLARRVALLEGELAEVR
jgi:hypothetical protein